MEGDLPSRKGLLQIGQSIDGFRSLFGTRSSSADVTGSAVEGSKCTLEQDAVPELSFFASLQWRRNVPALPGSRLALTIQKPLTDPFHLLRRRLRIRDQ